MYLVFKSVNPNVSGTTVYGVEFCSGKPTYITVDSDLIYVDIGDTLEDAVVSKVNQILNNISSVTIQVKVNTVVSCTLSNIRITGSNPDRQIPASEWNDVVQPAWYRVATSVDRSAL